MEVWRIPCQVKAMVEVDLGQNHWITLGPFRCDFVVGSLPGLY